MYLLTTMCDRRWDDLAEVFCRATSMQSGDKVLLQAIDLDALPLIMAVYKRALATGAASVDYQVTLPDLERHFVKHANDAQLNFFPRWSLTQMKKMDVFIAARARANGLNLKGIPPERTMKRGSVLDPILRERVDNTRWCITYVPTDHDAMLAEMSTPDYVDYFFNAALQDYRAMQTKNLALKELMERTDRVRILAPGTDLEFSIKGMNAISCHGTHNIPDGEVYTAPVRDSVRGTISYNVTSLHQGRDWSNISFEFAKGRIINGSCDQGKAELDKLLDTDEGARYIGEFAIGTNPGIRRPAKNTLFDEKIFGSFHLTPGSAYKEADNGNDSSLHWDLVKILSPEYGGGGIWFDGTSIMVNGKFVHPDLLQLNAE